MQTPIQTPEPEQIGDFPYRTFLIDPAAHKPRPNVVVTRKPYPTSAPNLKTHLRYLALMVVGGVFLCMIILPGIVVKIFASLGVVFAGMAIGIVSLVTSQMYQMRQTYDAYQPTHIEEKTLAMLAGLK
ncbi:MAG TPA: hypothetical protein PLL64_11385 [Rhodothermales bacterium]|nr:hypothetical protein [Rhodothermales bacterium]HRR08516.1 hypothetical protein [Rhodothermales bacterium]